MPENNINYYREHTLFELGLIEWCRQLGDMNKTFLDIGSHTGTYAISLARHFKDVHAFEPQRNTYYALCGGIALSNIKNVYTHHCALTEKVGYGFLNIVSEDGGGSTLCKTEKDKVMCQEHIKLFALDDFEYLNNIGFIKIDVEGYELKVLKGGLKTLANSNYPKILFESNYDNKELFNFIKELNYKIIKIRGFNNMFLAEQ